MEARLKAEMWFYRRMLRITWTSRINNVEVLERAGMKRSCLRLYVKDSFHFLSTFTEKVTWKALFSLVKLKGKGQEEDREGRF